MKKKMFLLLLIALVFSISCKKEKKIAIDDISDEDILIFDEDGFDSEPVQDESDPVTDEEASDDLSDGVLTDSDEDLTDEDTFVPLRFYVNINATGANTGLSWEDAFTKLQDAIDLAEEGYEIWVAKGTYKPDRVVREIPPVSNPGDDGYERFFHFSLKDKVAVLGGFAGNEKEKDQRDWSANKTILSGDLDDSGDLSSGDAYNVMLNINIYEDSILDGFTITGGNADYSLSPGVDLHPNQGGGINNRSTASPTIRNCIFKGNYAYIAGGAMANLKSHPQIYDSVFEENLSARGAALSNNSSSPYVQNTVFRNNFAEDGYGGAVFNKGKSRGFFIDCSFFNNIANDGGAMNNTVDSGVTVAGSVFSGNTANNGGAVSNSQSSPYFSDSVFENNTASVGGGAVENFSDASPRIVNCIFRNNLATGMSDGGAMLTNTGAPIVISSLFYGNTAYNGGAVANTNSSGYFISNTFSDNSALGQFGYGGGMFNQIDSNPVVTNSVFYFNSSENEGDEIFNNASDPVITNCNIRNSFLDLVWDDSLGFNAGGNFETDPAFTDFVMSDFSLLNSSPCIDKGTNAPFEAGGIALSFQEDLAGNPRISNELTDVGAYEYQK
jgi:hypothetical protein